MSPSDYRKMLKVLHLEGYAQTYEDAEYILESISDDEFYSLYEYTILNPKIVNHLISEGYTHSYEQAEEILIHMSENWKQSLVEEVLDERNRGERGMSDREVRRRRNLGLRDPRMSSSAFGDHGPQSAIQRFHRIRGQKRRKEHEVERNTRGDLGRVSGTGPASRYQSNDQEGYPSIRGNDGPF